MSPVDDLIIEELEALLEEQMDSYGYSFEEIIGVLEIAKIRLIQKNLGGQK